MIGLFLVILLGLMGARCQYHYLKLENDKSGGDYFNMVAALYLYIGARALFGISALVALTTALYYMIFGMGGVWN